MATAGSCFAQHIGRYLKTNGCNYLVTEPAHPMVGPKAERILNYGLFTARYGNVYTSRQLLQLLDRAYGRFTPLEVGVAHRCDSLTRLFAEVAYFPSYEIIAGGFASKNYFAPDGRSITEEGVAHVMRVFARHFLKIDPASEVFPHAVSALAPGTAAEPDASAESVARAMQLMCDEEALDIQPKRQESEPSRPESFSSRK